MIPRTNSSLHRAHSRGSFARLIFESEHSLGGGDKDRSLLFRLCQLLVIILRLVTPFSYLYLVTLLLYHAKIPFLDRSYIGQKVQELLTSMAEQRETQLQQRALQEHVQQDGYAVSNSLFAERMHLISDWISSLITQLLEGFASSLVSSSNNNNNEIDPTTGSEAFNASSSAVSSIAVTLSTTIETIVDDTDSLSSSSSSTSSFPFPLIVSYFWNMLAVSGALQMFEFLITWEMVFFYAFTLWMIVEAAFLPYYYYLFTRLHSLNDELEHFASDAETRFQLVKNCFQAMQVAAEGKRDGEPPHLYHRKMIEGWFLDQPIIDIYYDNYFTWSSWAFFGKDVKSLTAEEVEENKRIVTFVQQQAQWTFPPGSNPACKPVRLNLDPIFATQRPFFFYATIYLLNAFTHLLLRHWLGFQAAAKYDTVTRSQSIYVRRGTGPPRAASGSNIAPRSSSCAIPRKGNQMEGESALPVVFVHGIGIGFAHYLAIIANFPREVDVFLVEWPHVCMQMATRGPTTAESVAKIHELLDDFGHPRACFVAHSLGSALVSWMVHDALDSTNSSTNSSNNSKNNNSNSSSFTSSSASFTSNSSSSLSTNAKKSLAISEQRNRPRQRKLTPTTGVDTIGESGGNGVDDGDTAVRRVYPNPEEEEEVDMLSTNICSRRRGGGGGGGSSKFAASRTGTGSSMSAVYPSGRRNRVASSVLLDPVTFLLCDPTVATIFVYKDPRNTIDFLMHFFLSRELFIANALSRHFAWSHNILFIEELCAVTASSSSLTESFPNATQRTEKGETPRYTALMDHTIVLSSHDSIVPVAPVSRYLEQKSRGKGINPYFAGKEEAGHEKGRNEKVAGLCDNFEVLMFHGTHGEMMIQPTWVSRIARKVRERCRLNC